MTGNRKQKAIDPDDPEIIQKAVEVANRIRLVNFAMLKVEREIQEAVQVGLEAIVEVYSEGQKHRMASLESKVFY